jgi:succinate dehydrogenase / fumarate reductase cytochrome b subunit
MTDPQNAPVFLNLFRIRFPAGAIVSIAHRISGVLLFVSLPMLAWLLELSLRGPDGYDAAVALLQPVWVRVACVVLAWSLLHHLIAGLRFLLIDIHVGVSLPAARSTALATSVAGIVLTLLFAWWVL